MFYSSHCFEGGTGTFNSMHDKIELNE